MRVLISIFPEVSKPEVRINHVSVLVCWVLLRVPADSGGCRRCDVMPPATNKPAKLQEDSPVDHLSAESLSPLLFYAMDQLPMPRLATAAF